MKRLFTVVLVLSMVLLMSACMQEEDYFTRAEVEMLLAEQAAALQDQFEEEFNELGEEVEDTIIAQDAKIASLEAKIASLEAKIASLEAKQAAEIAALQAELALAREDALQLIFTPPQRYFMSLTDTLLGGNTYFAEIDTTVYGVVPNYGYGYIIIEVATTITVQIELIRVAPDGVWNLNIYGDGDIMNPLYTREEVVQGMYIIYELQPGFNTIEFDSYLEADYNFIVEITTYQP